MESAFLMYYLGKIPNMAYQCFWEEPFKKFGAMLEFTWWLSTQVSLVTARTMANFRIMTPFFAEMRNFSLPATLQTRDFWFATHICVFSFYYCPKEPKWVFFVKWLPRAVCTLPPIQFSQVGYMVGCPFPKFQELSRCAAIYWIIFELNPFKFKFERGYMKYS